VADGIIVLKRGLLERRPLRELEVLKMRGASTSRVGAVFTLEGGFKVFPPFKPKTVEVARKFEPRPDPEGYFSTGSRDLDEVLGGGYPKGSLVVVEVDKPVSMLHYHLVTNPTLWNFIAQGRGVLIVPTAGVDHTVVKKDVFEGGLTADEVNSLVRVFVRHYPELRPEPYVISFKGEDAKEDFERYASAAIELRRRARKPLLHIVGMDTLIDAYGRSEALWLLRTGLAIGRTMGDLTMVILKAGYPRAAEILAAMADVHLKITRRRWTALVYGVKPPTNVYALEMDVSEGYPMPKLTPVV